MTRPESLASELRRIADGYNDEYGNGTFSPADATTMERAADALEAYRAVAVALVADMAGVIHFGRCDYCGDNLEPDEHRPNCPVHLARIALNGESSGK